MRGCHFGVGQLRLWPGQPGEKEEPVRWERSDHVGLRGRGKAGCGPRGGGGSGESWGLRRVTWLREDQRWVWGWKVSLR